MVADAVQLGRCTLGQLAGELSSGPIKGSAMFRSVLGEVAEGIRSTAEGDLRDLIKAARLPIPLFNRLCSTATPLSRNPTPGGRRPA